MAKQQRTRSGGLSAAGRRAISPEEYAFPRERKEPLNDASHVRNAIARFDQVQGVSDDERDEAFRRIKRAAKKFDIEMTETRWQELGKPSAATKSSERSRAPSKAGRSRSDGQTRDELYAEASRRNIRGRSNMTKAQLQRALAG
jgi:hypothetical protein